jgi:hypothetical protein
MPPVESPAERYDRLLRACNYCDRCAARPLFFWFDLVGLALICAVLGYAVASFV